MISSDGLLIDVEKQIALNCILSYCPSTRPTFTMLLMNALRQQYKFAFPNI